MSLELLNSSHASQYYSAQLQYADVVGVAATNFFCSPANSSTFLGSCRLIQDPDGSLRIIQKTFGEVLGEKLVRPFVDRAVPLSGFFFSMIKTPMIAFDQLFTKSLRVLPEVAAASSDETALVISGDTQPETPDILDYWTQLIETGDKDCGKYIYTTADKRLAYGKDAELMGNCDLVAQTIVKLNFFFLEKQLAHKTWVRELPVKQECQILEVIQENFEQGVEEFRRGEESRFSFSQRNKKVWVIQLPNLSSQDDQLVQMGSLTLNGEKIAWHIQREESRACFVEEENENDFHKLKREMLQHFQPFILSSNLSFA